LTNSISLVFIQFTKDLR